MFQTRIRRAECISHIYSDIFSSLQLIVHKFENPIGGDVNYPAFIQAIDEEYTGQVAERETPPAEGERYGFYQHDMRVPVPVDDLSLSTGCMFDQPDGMLHVTVPITVCVHGMHAAFLTVIGT